MLNEHSNPEVIRTHHQNERRVLRAIVDGLLEVDGLGYIWRIAEQRRGPGGGPSRIVPVLKRRAEHDTGNYLTVKQTVDGVAIICMAHRLVWQFFKGDIPDGFEINHRNGIKTNNTLSNLEVVTRSENLKHSISIGIRPLQCGEDNPGAKFSDQDIEECRNLYASGRIKQTDISRLLGISKAHVSRIVKGQSRVT